MRSRIVVAWLIALSLVLPALLGAGPVSAAGECDTAANETYFPETNKCVPEVFYNYWVTHGGLAQQGLPLTDDIDEVSATDGNTYKVQYFERARFELHPENPDPAYRVLLGLVGNEQYAAKYRGSEPSRPGPCRPDEQFFAETQRCVVGRFYEYWLDNGGLAQQGYPISDPFMETNPTNGQQYLTQYFERARFELHPEYERPFDVLLGLLGGEQYDAKYPGITPIHGDSLNGNSPKPLKLADTPQYKTTFAMGGYRLEIFQPNQGAWTTYLPSNTSPVAAVNRYGLKDQRVEVSFTMQAGPTDATIDLYCRLQASNRDVYYLFRISPGDGYYSIIATTGPGPDDYKVVAGGINAPRLPAVRVGNAPTRLRADCVGDTLTLYVNGRKVAEGTDSTISNGGEGGFGATTYDNGGLDVVFKDFFMAIPHR